MTIQFSSFGTYAVGISISLLLPFFACLILIYSAMRRRYSFKTAFNCKIFNFLFETERPPDKPKVLE
jgi:hypothetical protein